MAGTATAGELRALECGNAVFEGLGQVVEADFGVVGGEKRREECGLVPIAEELNFVRAQIRRNALKDFGGGLSGREQQRRGDGTLLDCDDAVGFAAAIAGVAVGVKSEADAIAIGPRICREDCDFIRRGTPARSKVSRRMACLKAS